MFNKVRFEIATLCKSFATNFADKRFIARMNSFMFLSVDFLVEPFTTIGTFVLWFFSVSTFMATQVIIP
jgi:hypothetical protein